MVDSEVMDDLNKMHFLLNQMTLIIAMFTRRISQERDASHRSTPGHVAGGYVDGVDGVLVQVGDIVVEHVGGGCGELLRTDMMEGTVPQLCGLMDD